jgi:hypothetical protein
MSYRDKFPKGPDWRESDGNAHGVTIIHATNRTSIKKLEKYRVLTIELLKNQLTHAQESLAVRDKYWDQTRIERNTYLIEKQILERKVEELETELYFCNRNKQVGEIVDGY